MSARFGCVAVLLLSAFGAITSAAAQQSGKMPRIAIVRSILPVSEVCLPTCAFLQRLQELG
jgi:hypothetical protein